MKIPELFLYSFETVSITLEKINDSPEDIKWLIVKIRSIICARIFLSEEARSARQPLGCRARVHTQREKDETNNATNFHN